MSYLQVVTKADELLKIRSEVGDDVDIGFVPTMGNLHQGHISLLEEALNNHKVIFFSIFVNPKQFAPNEDYSKYPRTLREDLEKIERACERDCKDKNTQVVVFAPEDGVGEVFPKGYATSISVGGRISEILCAKSRPNHFAGVTTVVYRLFAMIRPTVAYFGMKDYQQMLIVKKMTEDMLLDIIIKGMPIVRDNDGLALSSRNAYLTAEERKVALILPKTLNEIKKLILESESELEKFISDKLLQDKRWDYLQVLNANDLQPLNREKEIIALGAFRVGNTRLIDNLLIYR
ncbi:MAG: pantoate--beta-alanine ligase [Oligoflexia bacterium]|nr:pantoate--beta-alanine ligase [Oligoflexia bacterium]